MRGPATSSWCLSRRLFTIGVAACYAIAFASLGVQVDGLFGSRGIVPLAEVMERCRTLFVGWSRLELPTLLWWSSSDATLSGLCIAGVALAVLAGVGVAPRWLLAALWAIYLSFVSVGHPFLSFQWDVLLLETGFLALFFAPGGWLPFRRGRVERPPSTALRWLLYWLLFRLMLLSGLVKLSSGDSSWLDGSALDFHYWTQPLPHRLSHYVHWMPQWFQRASVGVMFATELVVPLLIFAPFARRRCRAIVAGSVALLMAMISLTGNYGFFNLLTAVLCIPLVDDESWRRLGRVLARRRAPEPPSPVTPGESVPPRSVSKRIALGVFTSLVVLLTSARALESLGLLAELPGPLGALERRAASLASFNAYGLFRVMTKERPEILIEGTDDRAEWKPYGFRYKPLDLERAPVFAGLHMPRLDWQLWFAALEHRSPQHSAWIYALARALLEGSPPVLELLGNNPFPDGSPRFLRMRVALYEFSTPDERRAGVWWRSQPPLRFLPPMTLENGELRALR